MPLVTTKDMLTKAQKGHYAVGAFNVENMEMVKAVLSAAQECNSPVILQTTPSTIKYGTVETFASIVKAEAEKVNVPVALHLDHGNSFELAAKALKAGYTSIMIDASTLELSENIKITAEIVKMCHEFGVAVEAELGLVGGKEDDLENENQYTDPKEAKIFFENTGVDSLAVAVGTAHGFYATEPVLEKSIIDQVRALIPIPLVLHGGSGVPYEDVKDCIHRGMSKVNYATELRVAYSGAIRKLMEDDEKVYDPKKLGLVGMEAVKNAVIEKINLCGSTNMA